MSAHAYLNQKNEIVGFEYLNENAVPQNPCTACGGGTKPVTCESWEAAEPATCAVEVAVYRRK